MTKLPGIGSSMGEHIQEILQTVTLSAFEKVRRQVPPTLADLMRLEILGLKARLRILHDHRP